VIEERVQERVRTKTADLEWKVTEMSSQLCVQRRWIAQISEMMGIPPLSTTAADGEAETEADATFIPPSNVYPGIPSRSPSPPLPLSGAAVVGV
jgi:hypothetical protein